MPQAPSQILENIAQLFANNQRFVLTTHVNPDGDAMGSVLGLRHQLLWAGGSGRRVDVLLPSACPRNLMWMPGAEELLVWDGSTEQTSMVAEAEVIVVLDLNSISRLDTLGAAILASTARLVNVDHHTNPESFAHEQWVDPEAGSTCQMLAMMFGGSVPEAAAQCLYVGLMTDSGGFRFPRTTPEVFRLAAQLVESGADPVIAYEKVFNTNSVHRTRLLGHALAGMILHDGKLCTMTVTQADLAMYGCTIEDTEGFVHHTLSLEGVQMGVLFVELPGQIKCSFRSKGNVYVHALAASYNGGGHVHAAGARVPGRPLSEVMTEVVARALAAMTSE